MQVFQRLLATVFSVRRRLTGCTQRRRSATHSTINALQVHIIIINVVVVVVDGIVVVVQVVLARYVEVLSLIHISTVVGLFMTPETMGADSVASWLSAHRLSRIAFD